MSPRPFYSDSSILLDSSKNEDVTETCTEFIKAIAAKFEYFCALGPNQPLPKKVSFSDEETVHVLPSDPSGIFWINKRDLLQLYQQKYQIFNNSQSLEFKVLDLVAGFIEKSHQIYEKLYRFIVRNDSYDLYLTQIKVQIDDETTIDFPDSIVFNKLQNTKKYFNELANDLLNLLKPTYEMNEHLFKLIKSMDEKTIIDPNRFHKLNAEVIKMQFFHQDLANKIEKCPMDLYMQYLYNIRIETNNLEFKLITLDMANRHLSVKIRLLKKVNTLMRGKLILAMKIDFPKLNEATAKFCDLVKEAMVTMPQ